MKGGGYVWEIKRTTRLGMCGGTHGSPIDHLIAVTIATAADTITAAAADTTATATAAVVRVH